MLFHSLQFAVFFVIVYGLYLVLQHRWQNRMLLVASYVFYGAWDWRYLSLLILSTVLDYLCGIGLESTDNIKHRKLIVAASVVGNLALLCTFKYYDFFVLSFQELMGRFGISIDPFLLNVALPVGISFYTFQTMSYTIDVYRKKLPAARNPFDFALYVSYFPQLIAGPIERGTRLLPQILKPRVVTRENFLRGAYIFLWGIFLKIFVADNLARIADPIFASTGPYDGSAVILAVYAFSIQVYGDFAGYSFMAIGLGMAMGVQLMENFRRPYFSKNIGEFWRRWHISLSSWFRDYVFTPFFIHVEKQPLLSRFSMRVRHGVAFFFALFVSEYLLGLWHGAGWNFGFFGAYHAFAIWAFYMFRNQWNRMPAVLQIFLTFHIACLGWLFFRADSLGQAVDMLGAVFTNFNVDSAYAGASTILALVGFSAILVTVQVFQELKDDTYVVLRLPSVARFSFMAALIVLIMVFGDFSERPFIYFQF